MPYQGRLPYTYKSPYNYTLDQGTQTVPSLAFLGDTNNGLFSPATDNVAITTNGSEKLRVTSDGNIGIGVTNPSSKLHLAQTTSAANFTISNDINNWSIVTGTSVNSFSIVENQFGSTVFHANSSANVGIGTTNPTSKLSVYGGLSIGTSSASGSAHAFIIDGVNNSASNHTLTFSGHPNGTNDSVTWYLNRTGGAYGNFDVQFNGTSRFYISGGSLSNNGNIILNPINHTVISSGNVGLGTTNTEDRLDLASGFIRFKEAIGGTGTYGGIRAYNSLVPSVSATAIRFIRDVAEVGNDGAICFDTTNNERLRITSTGNIGIGTTNPSQKLHVVGSSYITDHLSVGIAQFGGNAGINVTKYGSKFFNDSPWMQPSGNVLIASRGISGQDNWIGIGGHYYATTGSANLLLQANFGDLGSVAGHYISSTATGTGYSYFSIGRMLAAGGVGSSATKEPQLNIDTSGNVGIGITNPSRKLHLYGTQSALRFTNTDTGSWAGLEWSVGNGTYSAYSGLLDSNGRYFIDVGSNGSDDLTILQSGNVGIGTTNPSQKFVVYQGNIKIQGEPSNFANLIFTRSDYSWSINNETDFRIYGGSGTTDSPSTLRLAIDSSGGHVIPGADATQNLGSTTKRWANIYSADLQLSNKGSANEVDGTWGAYTIQEGEEALYLINRRSGKKFKFVLEEVKD